MIHLIGPGASGKTTTGAALAERLSYRFVDLDQCYLERWDISSDISSRGYPAYVKRNVDLYLELSSASDPETVVALSSGFMTYDQSYHVVLAQLHRTLLTSRHTVLLMPSLEFDTCVRETVMRQLKRPFMSDDVEAHERVIGERYWIYHGMGSIQVTTDRPVAKVVDEIVGQLSKNADSG